jgi:hypothetical protein
VSTADYIIQVAQATEKSIWGGLCYYLHLYFKKTENEDVATDLAIGVANLVLRHTPADSSVEEFAKDNQVRIEDEARSLSRDRELCELLSGAAYNNAYGVYVALKGGLLRNRFLHFIREERKVNSYAAMQKLEAMARDLPSAVTEPIWNLRRLGLWIPREYSPDESDQLKAIQAFAAKQDQLVRESAKSS